jgi:hypothetical protein
MYHVPSNVLKVSVYDLVLTAILRLIDTRLKSRKSDFIAQHDLIFSSKIERSGDRPRTH